jgi:hypothetical protein
MSRPGDALASIPGLCYPCYATVAEAGFFSLLEEGDDTGEAPGGATRRTARRLAGLGRAPNRRGRRVASEEGKEPTQAACLEPRTPDAPRAARPVAVAGLLRPEVPGKQPASGFARRPSRPGRGARSGRSLFQRLHTAPRRSSRSVPGEAFVGGHGSLRGGSRHGEGHISRLKFLKRLMYGRASFELLRRRVLNAA